MKRFLLQPRFALSATLLSLTVFLSIAALPADSRADASTYSIDFHTISAGGNALRGNCYRLSGTVAQVAPGYSSEGIYSLIAGYWQPALTSATDEIFFNGFEVC
jgi:hypothetical protein